MDSSQTGRLTRRGLLGAAAGAAGAAAGATALPSWAPANEAAESEFRPRDRGPAPQRPNVLIIMADDLGWADLSAYGAPDIRTPNLDRLALSGIRFTQGYAATPMCSPTRFGLYTGRYPGRLPGGLPEPISAPNELHGIPVEQPTLASLLKGRGYRTRMFGKWHCGFLPWFSPTRVGWDEFFGSFGGEMDYFSKVNTIGDYDLYENEVTVEDLRYYTDIVTEKAVEFIGQKRGPWLANVNFTTPHCPWEGPNDQAVSKELTDRLLAGETGPRGPLFHVDGGSRAKYAEMVESLDAAVGKIVGALESTGQRRDTIILFTSDNGGERFSYLWPLSGLKGEIREGGIRVPAILSWPGAIPARKVSHTPVITMDWTATFIELAGAQPHPDYPLDGTSLAGHLLRGKAAPSRDLFWRRNDNSRALRRGNLKYYRSPQGQTFLHDLSQDEREYANLARKRPAELAQLVAAWEAINATLLPYPTN